MAAVIMVMLMSLLTITSASSGDRSSYFKHCTHICYSANCTEHIAKFYQQQQWSEKLLQWSCVDECEYKCMWPTVQHFVEYGQKIPQFHGKWPFVRILGCQEPASTIFSILNGVAHLYMLIMLVRVLPKQAPMYYMWVGCAVVSINAWVWSSVFHSRDSPVTEKLDYFSALVCVQYTLFCVLTRFLRKRPKWIITLLFTALLVFFTQHVYYMAFVHFHYGYNMMINVASGAVNSVIWLLWCAGVRKKQPYVWKAATVIICASLLVLLELGDFPPILWVFDAHSLWHGGTVMLPLLWYRFCIDDSLYLMDEDTLITFRTKTE